MKRVIEEGLEFKLLQKAMKISPAVKRVVIRVSGFDTRDLIENRDAWIEPTEIELLQEKCAAVNCKNETQARTEKASQGVFRISDSMRSERSEVLAAGFYHDKAYSGQ